MELLLVTTGVGRCCCAEEFCVLGAGDTSPLDDSYCLNPLDFCMETKWTLWCYFAGILLAMVSIVLLVNSVALHHKVLYFSPMNCLSDIGPPLYEYLPSWQHLTTLLPRP